MTGQRMYEEPDLRTDYSEDDTLDLVDQRLETATLPVSTDAAYGLFASFLEQRQPALTTDAEDAASVIGRWVAWASVNDPIRGRAQFLPLGDHACLMQCELTGEGSYGLYAASRIVNDFRDYVAVVTLLS